MKLLWSDDVVAAILKGKPREKIEKLKVTGADLAALNDRKLEKWWGVPDPRRRVIVLGHIEDNNPIV